MLPRINTDYYAGILMLLLGLGAAFQGMSYQIGTLSRMGPGFFPVALGGMLAVTGIAIALSATGANSENERKPFVPEWRGWACIALSIVAFVVLGQHTGLLPATFAIVFISALGDRQNTIKDALLLALAVMAVSVLVFWWALQLQLPLFRWR